MSLIEEREAVRRAWRELGQAILKTPMGKVYGRLVYMCLDGLTRIVGKGK